MEEKITPCIQICRYDSKGMCYGCQRTVKEIGEWFKYTPAERKAIMDELPSRKNAEDMPQFQFYR